MTIVTAGPHDAKSRPNVTIGKDLGAPVIQGSKEPNVILTDFLCWWIRLAACQKKMGLANTVPNAIGPVPINCPQSFRDLSDPLKWSELSGAVEDAGEQQRTAVKIRG